MNRYTIYCSTEQVKKAIELGAPIIDNGENPNVSVMLYNRKGYVIPTAEQMLGYLRTKGFKFCFDDIYNYWGIMYGLKIIAKGTSADKELAAINAALDYLIKAKEE